MLISSLFLDFSVSVSNHLDWNVFPFGILGMGKGNWLSFLFSFSFSYFLLSCSLTACVVVFLSNPIRLSTRLLVRHVRGASSTFLC